MNWLIFGVIVLGLLVLGGVAVMALTSQDKIIGSEKTTGCSSCGNSCTADKNCGLATCGAANGGSCSCGKK